MAGVTDSRPALAGVTVLDLATFLAAPLCATFLGEFGAEVIKVEQPGVGDDLRRLGASAGGSGSSYWWFVEARNKKSITCNLRDPEGQALIRRLVASTAVVTENFRPGTLERWNLGWAELSRVRPALVMLRISAFGQTGPHRARPGFGRIAAAVGGLAYLSGYPDRPPVSPGTPTVPDYLAGVFGALGALLALRHAERTGEGQVVDLGLYEPVLRILDDAIAVYGASGQVRARENILSLVALLVGAVAMPAVVPRLTLTPGRVEHAGPTTPGEHNEEIYAGRLGLSRADLARLRERGVI